MSVVLTPFDDDSSKRDVGDFLTACIGSLENGEPARVAGYGNGSCLEYFIKHGNYYTTQKNVLEIDGNTYSPTRALLQYFFYNENIPDIRGKYCSRDGEMVACIDDFINMIIFERQWTRSGKSVVRDFLDGTGGLDIDFVAELCHTPEGELVSCFELIVDSVKRDDHPHADDFASLYSQYVQSLLANPHNAYADARCRTSRGDMINCIAKLVLDDNPEIHRVVDAAFSTDSHLSNLMVRHVENMGYITDADGYLRHVVDVMLESYAHNYPVEVFFKSPDVFTIVTGDGSSVETSAFNKMYDMLENISLNRRGHAPVKYFSSHTQEFRDQLYDKLFFEMPRSSIAIDGDGCIDSHDGSVVSCFDKILTLESGDPFQFDMRELLYKTTDLAQYECEHADGYVTTCLNAALDRLDLLPLVAQNQIVDLGRFDCIDDALRPITCIDKLLSQYKVAAEGSSKRRGRSSPNRSEVDRAVGQVLNDPRYNFMTIRCHSITDPDKTINCFNKVMELFDADVINPSHSLVLPLLRNSGDAVDARRCTDERGNKITCFQRVVDLLDDATIMDLISDSEMTDRLFEYNCRIFEPSGDGGVQAVPIQGIVYLLYKLHRQFRPHSIPRTELLERALVSTMMHDKYATLPDTVVIDGEVFDPVGTICSVVSMTDIKNYLANLGRDDALLGDLEGVEMRERSLEGKTLEIYGKCKCRPRAYPEPFEVLSKTQINKRLRSRQWTKQDLADYKVQKQEWEERRAKWESDQVIATRVCHDELCWDYTDATSKRGLDAREWIRSGDLEWGMRNLSDPYALCGVYSVVKRADVSQRARNIYEQKFRSLFQQLDVALNGVSLSDADSGIQGRIMVSYLESPDIIQSYPKFRIKIVTDDVTDVLFDQEYSFVDLIETIQDSDDTGYKSIGDIVKQILSRSGSVLKDVTDVITSRPSTKDTEMKLIISRRPYDMLRASSCQNWSSCFDLKKDYHSRSIKMYMDHDGYIAYLASDEFSPTWHARMWILPTVQQTDDVCFATQTVYGLYKDLMHDAVNAILHEKGYNTLACDECEKRSATLFPWDGLRTVIVNRGVNACIASGEQSDPQNCRSLWMDYVTMGDRYDYNYATSIWVDCPNNAYSICDHEDSPVPRIGAAGYNAILKRRGIEGDDGMIRFVEFVTPLEEYPSADSASSTTHP